MSTEFTGELSAGESKTGKQIRGFGVLILVVFLIIGVVAGLFSMRPDRAVVYEDRRAAEVAQAQARAEEYAVASARVNEELRRFGEGAWYFQGHTRGTEREVYIDTPIVVDRNGKIKEFSFDHSFTRDGTHYANTWQCEATQLDRYDCSITQRYTGGSWRGRGNLTRESEILFSGRYLYENQWHPISLVMKNE